MIANRPTVVCAAAGDAGKSRTRQSEAALTDINAAVRKYRKTGALTGCLQNTRKAMFGDFSESPNDFLEANIAVVNARCAFAGLPARVRERFGNDPVALLSFLADSANTEEAIKLGLVDGDAVAAEAARKKASEAASADSKGALIEASKEGQA